MNKKAFLMRLSWFFGFAVLSRLLVWCGETKPPVMRAPRDADDDARTFVLEPPPTALSAVGLPNMLTGHFMVPAH